MSEAEFTKGEWIVLDGAFVYALNDDGVNQFDLTIQGHGDKGASDNELQANAHLIAAAPELYDFIEDLSQNSEDVTQREEAKRLLAKARGEV